MSYAAIVEALLAIGRRGDYCAVTTVSGAGVQKQVLSFSDSLRRTGLARIEALSATDRVAFTKALAAFENTVGGLGSVTALERVLPLVDDCDHALLDWILSMTESYWYYSNGAKSYAELLSSREVHKVRREEERTREVEREGAARARKVERATTNLFNAVRRGDLQAVQALLVRGANPHDCTPDGVALVRYAELTGRIAIAEVLRKAAGGESAT